MTFQHYIEQRTFHGKTRWCIFTEFRGELFIFRYAYESQERAAEVANNLRNGNKNCDQETNLAFNYWNLNKLNYDYKFSRHHSAKNYDHIVRTEVK